MGQAFSTANVSFCRTDIPVNILKTLAGWDYDRICNAWASLIISDEAHTAADGTPQIFLADLPKLQRITGLSKSDAEHIGQLFSIRTTNASGSPLPYMTTSSTSASSHRTRETCRRLSTSMSSEAHAAVYPMLEILMVTVVLGNLHRLTKLSLIFSLFDVKGEGSLSEAEFFLMCYFVFRGLAKAVKRPIPGYASIEPLVLSTFDELQNAQCGTKHGSVISNVVGGHNEEADTKSDLQKDVPDVSVGAFPKKAPSDFVGRGASRITSREEAERTTALVEQLFAKKKASGRQKLCCRREMTIGEFIKLTLKPGSAIDIIFKGMQGDCTLSIASNLAFRHSHQFQTRLFQNVFLVHQWLQDKATDRVSNGHIRLTDLVAVCLDLCEKSADIVREVYNVIATDKRMALQGMVHIEVAPACESGTLGVVATCAQSSSNVDLVAGDGDDETLQAETGTVVSRTGRRKIPAYILTGILVDHHIRRQLRHWWPQLRVESAFDTFPEKRLVFKKLMDVFSSRLFGSPVRGATRLKCRINSAEELKIRSVIQGGQEPWIEISVTQGYDNGRGPPIRVMGEAKTRPLTATVEDGSVDWNEEIDIELPDVRDNYYLILTVKCNASDSDVVAVGRGSLLLSDLDATGKWSDTTFHITPSHSPAVYFTSETPRIDCSLLLEPASPSAAPGTTIECSPSRLNGLDMHVRDVVHLDCCTVSLHLENGHHSFSTSDSNDMSSVAVSIGIAYQGKPVAGIAYFPFAESQSLVSFTEYGILSPVFWKDPTTSQIEVPARPSKYSCRRRSFLQRSRRSSRVTGNSNDAVQRRASQDSSESIETIQRPTVGGRERSQSDYSLIPSPQRHSGRRRRSTGETGMTSELPGALQTGKSLSSRRISTQGRCTIPTGKVPISLRFLDAKEFFLYLTENAFNRERPILLSSGKGVLDRIKPLLKQSARVPTIQTAAGSPLKVARLVRGDADIAVEFDVRRLWSLCGSDALLRAVGGCLVDENGEELIYNDLLSSSAPKTMFAFVKRSLLLDTFLLKDPS
ncbi:inositol monophosphatase family protein [Toxoplasma gondii ARI]|uniref:3'(2'),5'-bisphosphate nucleotidase n=1 Tax=Toxoplasma gondii ARI TaxID=1074872 RepID=A0A139Y5G1_TOXGO|nr:inositol monophosphatase family protein [Toxoplasma gondii ARI]